MEHHEKSLIRRRKEFGKAKHIWRKTFLTLPNGTPSHDTIRRLFERFDLDEFRRCFLGGIEAIREATDREVVAIDGKTLRRSFDRAGGKSALHMVHAWATTNHLLLGQLAVNEKSNEITAIPKPLKMLELTGAIVTIDAMGCPKEIARTIEGLEANHEHLFDQVVAFFAATGRRSRIPCHPPCLLHESDLP